MSEITKCQIDWEAWRIIPSRNPPIDLYRRVAPPEDWESVINVELLTNPRVRELREGLGLVRPEDLKGGATQNWNLAPFTYLNPEGSRFSDGSFGTCLMTKDFEAALIESLRLRQEFLRRTEQGPIRLDMRVIKTVVSGEFDDASKAPAFESEGKRKAYWKQRQVDGCDGVLFRTIEFSSGRECVEAFRPRVMKKATQERHLTYSWDGQAITEIYDFLEGRKVEIEHLTQLGEVRFAESQPVGRATATS